MTDYQNHTRTKPNLTRMAIVAGIPLLDLGIVWYVADPRVGNSSPPQPVPVFGPLRLQYNGQRGVLTVFDAPNPPDEPRPPAYGQTPDYGGYLAIWRGYDMESPYVFGRVLYTEVDLGLMLLIAVTV